MKFLRLSREALLLLGLLVLLLFSWAYFRYEQNLHAPPDVVPPAEVTPSESVRVLPGFKIELLHVADDTEGSWISMAFDPKGRLIVSPEGDTPLLRLTITGRKTAEIERIPQPVRSAMGLLYARDSLFLDGQGPMGWGIYRMRARGDAFGSPEMLCPLDFSDNSHGAHGLVLGPDDKLYVVCGDHTQLPTDISPSSPFQNFAEDELLPDEPDPTGWDISVRLPEGFVFSMDLDGKNRQLIAGGTRNVYAVAFNPDGELFGFDNDHQQDIGAPWYRPTRINHWIPGADFGHRQGSGKFPEYYEDTLPAALNVGLSAPSGVAFAPANCAFPSEYRGAFFMADWVYGRVFAAHLFPDGATYKAKIETLLRGIPLNVVSLAFGPDGNLYFITGGWGLPSGLYRLSWSGPSEPSPPKTAGQLAAEKEGGQARRLRHQLESFQGHPDPGAIEVIWPALGSEDRWIRYAARVALEFQPVASWEKRAVLETNVLGGLTALMALARCGGASAQPDFFMALQKFHFSALTEEQRLLKLRVMELSFIRQGRPTASLAADVITELDPLYPSESENVNHELCQLLLYLNAPQAIPKSLALMDNAPFEEEQIYYVMRLRNITNGWTLAERKEYLGWFLKDRRRAAHPSQTLQLFTAVDLAYRDGDSFGLFLDNFRQEAASTLSPAERQALSAFLPSPHPAPVFPAAPTFVRAWRLADLAPDIPSSNKGRHLARGLRVMAQCQCLSCHRFGNTGSAYGPDLTTVGSRMRSRDILESIIEPSKVIAQQYRNTLLTLKDGDELLGRVIGEDDNYLFVLTDHVNLTRTYVPKTNIVSRRISKISPMPEGLLNAFTEDEIWDLIAKLKSGFPTNAVN